jgi:NADPH-dependent 2,4-dienoyl-CoA reductase/sulfur reductase-like enzyme/pSer/pThr/pTyr-binding forkhead associated (FHA) protein/Fe-S-cluster-containing hydrogenase component 2/CRP-like cAMP-binding protein
MSEPLTHVIVGDGVAGMSAAQIIRTRRPADRIMIISGDPQPFYYRAALTNYLLGELKDEELWAMPPQNWTRLQLNRVHGVVSRVDTGNQQIHLEDGRRVEYDRMLIATGARCRSMVTPDVDPKRGVPGADLPGVQVMRTLADTRNIIESVARTRRAVILGGGILGLEIAHGLLARNIKISLLHRGNWLMERVVSRRAGELIQNRMSRAGVDIYLSAAIKEIRGSARGMKGVVLTDGTRISSSLLVQSIGILPNTEWLAGSGIQLDGGFIRVDRKMKVEGAKNVWAAGDVTAFVDAELPFANPGGLWQPARKHGQVAGMNMSSGDAEFSAEYRPGVIYNATRAWDLDLGTLGDHVDSQGTKKSFEERRRGKPILKTVLIREGHVVGAELLGNRDECHALKHLMNMKGADGDVSDIADRIFDPQFDLSGWVAKRSSRAGLQRYKQTLVLPAGAMPPSVASAMPTTTQLQIASNTSLHTRVSSAVKEYPIVLRTPEQTYRFDGPLVRIGTEAGCHVQLPTSDQDTESIELSIVGTQWTVKSTRVRIPKARHNGRSLTQAEILSHGDSISLHGWRAVVQLESKQLSAGRQYAEAELVDEQKTVHRIKSKVTTLGAGRDNDIQLSGIGISLFHAQLHRVGSPTEFYLMDAGSQSGTFVNGKPVFAPALLAKGDQIKIGAKSLTFRPTDTPPLPAPLLGHDQEGHRENLTGRSMFLISVEGTEQGRSFEIRLPGTVGRDDSATVTINDSLLSRQHVKIEAVGSRIEITDLQSLNGTVIDGRKLSSNEAVSLTRKSRIHIGQNLFQLSDKPEIVERDEDDDAIPNVVQLSRQPHLLVSTDGSTRSISLDKSLLMLGRDPQNDVVVNDPSVSRVHLKFKSSAGRVEVIDVGSSHGTFLNGVHLVPDVAVKLTHDDTLILGVTEIRFRQPESAQDDQKEENSNGPKNPSSDRRFKIDFANFDDPLAQNLGKIVSEELDACIGCHECMRACPLPDSATVTIGSLNNYAGGVGKPSNTALQFVQDCTQCQACVPVCPADIKRSRIVLWNKLKETPSPEQRINIQVANEYYQSEWTVGELANHLSEHPILGKLNGPERTSLVGTARFRQILAHEQLIAENEFPDAIWVIINGSVEVGMTTSQKQFQRMVVLHAGQTIGEAALLSDQSSDVSAYAIEKSVVMGLPKYVLKSSMSRNKVFRQAMESLYISRSIEVFVKKVPSLADASDELLRELIDEFQAERYLPGREILNAEDALRTFCVVRRGFVKEIRNVEEREMVVNYLNEGDSFGASSPDRRGLLLRFEAATLAEVLTIDLDRIHDLESRWPGLIERLMPLAARQFIPESGRTEMYQKAASAGLLQATQLMVIDTRSCVDCDNCVSACERRHGAARLDRSNAGLQIGPFQVPASCYHCDDPVCLLCAVDGIVREPSGEIRIVPENCIGCSACAERCPYDNIQMIPRGNYKVPFLRRVLPKPLFDLFGFTDPREQLEDFQKVASKCDLCSEYADGPACVRSCPTGAAQRVNPLELFMGKRS